MLVLSCIALWWVHQAHQDAFILLFLSCSVFLPSLRSVNETCYVYMVAIISSGPFWLMVTKGLLLYALSTFMPFLCLLWSDPVACCYLGCHIPHIMPCFASCCLRIAPWLIVDPFPCVLAWVEPGDEYVIEEPVEYAYEDQVFVKSENSAG